MAPALASKALDRVWVPAVGCTFMSSISPLAVVSLVSTYGSPCPMASKCAVVCGNLSKTSPAIIGPGAARSTPVCPSPPMASLSHAVWGTDWAAALPCLGWGSHQFGNLLHRSCGALPRVDGHGSPSPYFVPDLLILTFHLLGSNH